MLSSGGSKGFAQNSNFMRLFALVSLDWSLVRRYTFLDEVLKQSQSVTWALSPSLEKSPSRRLLRITGANPLPTLHGAYARPFDLCGHD
jgi:hypothetical protein